MIAVTAPTASSRGDKIVRAIKSQITIKIPPNKNDIGKTILCFEPKNFRTACGAIKSTKPIMPTNETIIPMSKEETTNNFFLTVCACTPKLNARSSPNVKISASIEWLNKKINAITVQGNITFKPSQPCHAKLPICQKSNFPSFSAFSETITVRIAFIKRENIIPVRISVLSESERSTV